MVELSCLADGVGVALEVCSVEGGGTAFSALKGYLHVAAYFLVGRVEVASESEGTVCARCQGEVEQCVI